MRASTRTGVFTICIAASTWACGGSEPGGGSTIMSGGNTSAGMGGASGSLSLGGAPPNAGNGGSGGSAGTPQGGTPSGGGGHNGGASMGGANQGCLEFAPKSAGVITATIDGKPQTFDQVRLTRQVSETSFSIEATKKDCSFMGLSFTMSFSNGLGTYDCVTNMVSYYDETGETRFATASTGSCSVTVSQMSTKAGEPLKFTFTALLPGDKANVTVSAGTADLTSPN